MKLTLIKCLKCIIYIYIYLYIFFIKKKKKKKKRFIKKFRMFLYNIIKFNNYLVSIIISIFK